MSIKLSSLIEKVHQGKDLPEIFPDMIAEPDINNTPPETEISKPIKINPDTLPEPFKEMHKLFLSNDFKGLRKIWSKMNRKKDISANTSALEVYLLLGFSGGLLSEEKTSVLEAKINRVQQEGLEVLKSKLSKQCHADLTEKLNKLAHIINK